MLSIPPSRAASLRRVCRRGLRTAAVLLHRALLWSVLGSAAQAHDPPHGTGVFQAGTQMLLRSNRGLLLRADPAEPFRLLCNEALGIETYEVPSIVARADGRWLIGTSRGLLLASADLCTLSGVAPLAHTAIGTLVQDASDASLIYASTANTGAANGLYESRDSGDTFAAYGQQNHEEVWTRLQLSALDGQLVYASGRKPNPAAASGSTALFAVSSDRALHFGVTEIALGTDEYSFELLGVIDGTSSTLFGVVHAYLGTLTPDRLLVSHDSGQHWDQPLTTSVVDAFAVRASDPIVWVGSSAGLWRIDFAGSQLSQLQTQPVSCLSPAASSALYVCDGTGATGGLSISHDEGMTLDRVVSFPQVAGLLQCPANADVTRLCQMPWSDWQREVPAPVTMPDVSAVDAGTTTNDDDAASEPPSALPGDAVGVAADAGASDSASAAPAPVTPTMPASASAVGQVEQGVAAVLDASTDASRDAMPDATVRHASTSSRASGCACRVSPGLSGEHSPAAIMFSLLAISLFLRRRRRLRSPRSRH